MDWPTPGTNTLWQSWWAPIQARMQRRQVADYAKQTQLAQNAPYGSLAQRYDPSQYGSLARQWYPDLFTPDDNDNVPILGMLRSRQQNSFGN